MIGQVDGCPIGGPISVVLSNRFCGKMEFDIVNPLTLKLYKCFVDDFYRKHIENEPPECKVDHRHISYQILEYRNYD